jgi:hypothetical protein
MAIRRSSGFHLLDVCGFPERPRRFS